MSLEMQSVLLWQTNHYKKMHNIWGKCGSDFILFYDAFHVLCLYVPSSSISLTRNTHPLYLTQLHRWCMFSTLQLTCIITSVNTLNPPFLTFWTNPIHSFWGQYVMKGLAVLVCQWNDLSQSDHLLEFQMYHIFVLLKCS